MVAPRGFRRRKTERERRDRREAKEEDTMKIVRSWRLSRPSHHGNRCLADLRLWTDYYVFLTRHRLNLNIELCSPIRSSRHANFRLTTPRRIQLIRIQVARFQPLASNNAVNPHWFIHVNLLSENFNWIWSHFYKKKKMSQKIIYLLFLVNFC